MKACEPPRNPPIHTNFLPEAICQIVVQREVKQTSSFAGLGKQRSEFIAGRSGDRHLHCREKREQKRKSPKISIKIPPGSWEWLLAITMRRTYVHCRHKSP